MIQIWFYLSFSKSRFLYRRINARSNIFVTGFHLSWNLNWRKFDKFHWLLVIHMWFFSIYIIHIIILIFKYINTFDLYFLICRINYFVPFLYIIWLFSHLSLSSWLLLLNLRNMDINRILFIIIFLWNPIFLWVILTTIFFFITFIFIIMAIFFFA